MVKIYFKTLSLLIFLVLSRGVFSQNEQFNVGSTLLKNLDFTVGDSLNGFDENLFRVQAISEEFFGDEFHMYMYHRKREFIDTKYNLYSIYNPNAPQAPQPNQYQPGGKGQLPGGNIINAAPCVNEDFELNNFSGWTVSSGNNIGNCAPTTPNIGSTEAWIRTTPWVDPNFPGNVPNSPLGGTRIAQLNNNNVGSLVTRIVQTFPVTAGNALFQYAYCAVFNGAHNCCQRPFLKIDVLNCSNVILACPQVSIVAPGGVGCGPAAPGFTTVGAISKCLWQIASLDLTSYIGTCITIRVTVGDCSGGAHQGYCYFDSRCMPMNYIINGNVFPAGVQATTVTACGAITATVTGPPGLAPYLWNGPVGSGVVNNPNQTFTTSMAGQYTLTLNPPGACSPTIKFVTIVFAPNPTPGFTSSNMCNVFTFSNTGTPAPSVQTYSFAGPGVVPGFTTVATNTSVTFPIQGNYTVTQVITTTAGCNATFTAVIIVPPAPDVTFSTPTPTQCLTGNSYVFTAGNPVGVHAYSFSPGVGAPPPGNTPNYGPVNFTLPGTYTVTHSVTAGGCTSYTTMLVVINPMPTPTVSNNSPTCINSTINLFASGGNTYQWTGPNAFTSAIQNPTITNATLLMNGSYSVLVTSIDACTAIAVTNVTVYALPSPSIASNNPPCEGTVLNFTATGGTNYIWSGPNAFTSTLTSPSIPNVQLAASGIYTLVSGAGGCTVSTTASVIINPLPNVVAGNNSPVCLNQPLNFTGGGAIVYSWAGPNGYSSNLQNPSVPIAAFGNNGVYTLTASDVNSCVNTATTNVVVNPLPNLVVNNPTTCVNSIINLNAAGASIYSWTGPNGFTSNQQNPVIPMANLLMTGQYILLGTSAQGCTANVIANVSVSPLPIATIAANDPCFGATLNLIGGGGINYFWTGPNGFTSTSANNSINNVTLPANGIYTLLVSVNTCTNLTTADVTIHPLPTPVISMITPVCFSQPTTFTASGGTYYIWNGPSQFSSTAVSPIIAAANNSHNGIYTLTAIDGYSCVNTTTAEVIVLPIPDVVIFGSTVCVGHTATVTSKGGVSYEWFGPNGFTTNQQNFTLPNFTPNANGLYTLVVTGSNNCKHSASTPVLNWPVPTPTASNSGPVCLNGEVKFTSQGGYLYQWHGPNGFIAGVNNTVLKSANSTDYSGTYTLGVTDDKGCQGFTTTNLLVKKLPEVVLQGSAANNCIPFCSNFKAVTNSSLQSIQWNMNDGGDFPGNTYSHCFDYAGSHVLKSNYTDKFGCTNSSSVIIEAYPIPVADFYVGTGAPSENEEVEFKDASQGDALTSWTWFINSNNPVFKQNPTKIFENPGTYPVAMIVANQWGCMDTIVKPVVINEGFNLFVPNAFSPNGDGLNDIFQPKGYGVTKYNLMIFDRWGEKLFISDDFYKGWDGTFKGEVCKHDTYIWKIVAQGPDNKKRELTGIVTIVQ